MQVAVLFLFLHKRLCGPLANRCFHYQPDSGHRPESKLEAGRDSLDLDSEILRYTTLLKDLAFVAFGCFDFVATLAQC